MPYATTTRTRRNIAALREHGWGLLLTPDIDTLHDGFRYALDNGAWGAFQRGEGIDFTRFERLVSDFGKGADWIAVPDIVCGGLESLRLTAEWLPRLEGVTRLMVPVQNGHTPSDVRDWLCSDVGIFVGGDTDWKEQSLPMWGELAAETGAPLHVARVNTRRRIRLCAMAGADSFDGTSVTRFAVNIHHLDAERNQCVLFSGGY